DPALLQAKVDSLNQVYARLTSSLGTLDSLLVGSDRWSRFLDHLTRATGEGSGIWLDKVVSTATGTVTISGSARTRGRVSEFTRELDGVIKQLSSVDVKTKGGEVTIYNFQMSTTVKSELPEVALYLRDRAITEDDFSDLEKMQRMPAGYEATPMTDAASRRNNSTEGGR
ncbi:MAG: PilN domain-containing protein, partial [Rhodothermia bacterium]